MKTIQIELSEDDAWALMQVINEHVNQRLPIETYIDQRYATHSAKFRSEKASSVAERIMRLLRIKEMVSNPKGETV